MGINLIDWMVSFIKIDGVYNYDFCMKMLKFLNVIDENYIN